MAKRDPYLKKCPFCGNFYSTRGYGAYRKHKEACARKTRIKKLKTQIEHWEKSKARWTEEGRDEKMINYADRNINTLKVKLENGK